MAFYGGMRGILAAETPTWRRRHSRKCPHHAWAGRSVEAAPASVPKPPNAKNPASEEDGVFEMREEKKMRLADLAATDFPAS